MKIVRFCLLLIIMLSIAPAQAQDTDSIPWYGRLAVGFGHDDVRNVDIGLLSVIPALEGFQVGLIAGGVHNSMSGVGIYGIRWVRGRFSDPFVTLASNKRIKMNATTWIKIFQKSGSENRPLICPEITIHPNGQQKGVKSITLDGQKIDGTIIPYSPGKHTVEVTM